MNKEHYLPIVGRLKNNVWLITAMGSRGLLYHAYCAEKLSEAIVADNDACIPDELKMMLLNNKKMK